jgi:hypothetical protein
LEPLVILECRRQLLTQPDAARLVVSITMNGTLSTFDVYSAIFRRILRRSIKRSRMSWLRPSRRTTMCSAAMNADRRSRAADQNASGEHEQAADNHL